MMPQCYPKSFWGFESVKNIYYNILYNSTVSFSATGGAMVAGCTAPHLQEDGTTPPPPPPSMKGPAPPRRGLLPIVYKYYCTISHNTYSSRFIRNVSLLSLSNLQSCATIVSFLYACPHTAHTASQTAAKEKWRSLNSMYEKLSYIHEKTSYIVAQGHKGHTNFIYVAGILLYYLLLSIGQHGQRETTNNIYWNNIIE